METQTSECPECKGRKTWQEGVTIGSAWGYVEVRCSRCMPPRPPYDPRKEEFDLAMGVKAMRDPYDVFTGLDEREGSPVEVCPDCDKAASAGKHACPTCKDDLR